MKVPRQFARGGVHGMGEGFVGFDREGEGAPIAQAGGRAGVR